MKFGVAGLVLLTTSAVGQISGSLDASPVKAKQYVSFAGEPQVVAAGRTGTLELHFRVDPGFHINSHTPKSELLIPTLVELAPATGVKVAAADYPHGKSFTFAFDPTEKLDVYQDDFVVKVPVVAAAGEHEIKGVLKYQACNHAACYPPRTLPIDVLFTAR